MDSPASWGAPVLWDDFTGTALNTAAWNIYDKPAGHPPRSPSAVRVDGGELQLVGGLDSTGKDVGGGVSQKFAQLYGRWQARVRVDAGAGYSGVVLLWPKSNRWPEDGEIDALEAHTADRQSALNYLHNGATDVKQGNRMNADFTQWHTIAVEWLPSRVTFWLDNVVQWQVTKSDLIPSTSPMHLALQLDQGCNGFIPCRDSQTPMHVVMHVDWVKVYTTP